MAFRYSFSLGGADRAFMPVLSSITKCRFFGSRSAVILEKEAAVSFIRTRLTLLLYGASSILYFGEVFRHVVFDPREVV